MSNNVLASGMHVDLHVHTTASDGTDSPREVVYKAEKLNLRAIAITDHDTFYGLDDALKAAGDTGVELVSGIELSTEFQNQEVHILGYLADTRNENLTARLESFRKSRIKRINKIVTKLQALGFPLSMEEVLAQASHRAYNGTGKGTVGRPHVARVLVQKGIVNSVSQAFDRYIGKGKIAFVPRVKYDPLNAVDLIRQAGGVAVLAHPGLANIDDYIPELITGGLQGIEVYHPQHDWQDTRRYLRLASDYDLLATGGSDYHGPDAGGIESLGTITVDYSVVEEIHRLAGK